MQKDDLLQNFEGSGVFIKKVVEVDCERYSDIPRIMSVRKGALLGLRQFLATQSPLKMM